MKNTTFENYVTLYFGEDSKEVINFFKHDIPKDKIFRNEKEFINKVINLLHEYCCLFKNDKFCLVTCETETYWLCRNKELPEKVRYVYNNFDKKNLPKILRVMRIVRATKEANKFEGDIKALSSHLKKLTSKYEKTKH